MFIYCVNMRQSRRRCATLVQQNYTQWLHTRGNFAWIHTADWATILFPRPKLLIACVFFFSPRCWNVRWIIVQRKETRTKYYFISNLLLFIPPIFVVVIFLPCQAVPGFWLIKDDVTSFYISAHFRQATTKKTHKEDRIRKIYRHQRYYLCLQINGVCVCNHYSMIIIHATCLFFFRRKNIIYAVSFYFTQKTYITSSKNNQ